MSLKQTARDYLWVKLLRKPEKVYPARIEKYKKRGDTWKKEFDRGRKVTDPQTGDEEYEFLNEHNKADSVPYEYVRQTDKGPELSLLMPDRDVFIPFHHTFEKEGQGGINLEYSLDQKNWYRWKENEWQRTSQIVEEKKESWLKENSTAIMMVMMGLGFLFSFYGFGEYMMGNMDAIAQSMPSEEALQNLAEAYRNSPVN